MNTALRPYPRFLPYWIMRNRQSSLCDHSESLNTHVFEHAILFSHELVLLQMMTPLTAAIPIFLNPALAIHTRLRSSVYSSALSRRSGRAAIK